MRIRSFITLIIVALFLSGCDEKNNKTDFNEEAALDFLYEYLPLGDNVDYSREYYQECVSYAF